MNASELLLVCAGHSLGGALATLAAYDIQTAFGFRDLQVYTYGAPRTGNHAFARYAALPLCYGYQTAPDLCCRLSELSDILCCREYEDLVPETWHVVNDADVIPRVGKFVRLYKRPGARVIVDRKGSIVVRPSALELHLRPSEIHSHP